MEVALRRLEGVEKVVISIERQQFEVFYKPNASFQPAQLREAVSQASVSVTQFNIQVRGKVEKLAGGQFLVAGRDRFSLTSDSKPVSLNTELILSGQIVNDRQPPYQLKVLDSKAPATKPGKP